MATCDSNDHEESILRILIDKEAEIGIEFREISKDWIRDNNVEEPTISKDLEGFRCRTLLVDHSAIDFKSVFKAKQIAKKIEWVKGFEKNYIICIHEELGGQRNH